MLRCILSIDKHRDCVKMSFRIELLIGSNRRINKAWTDMTFTIVQEDDYSAGKCANLCMSVSHTERF